MAEAVSPSSSSAPAAGAESVKSAGTPSSAPTEPTVLDLSDENALIKVKGSDKPVKFGDHVKGFQSQFTKASQRAAQLEKELQARDAQLREYQQAAAAAQQRTGQAPDVFDALRKLPYLTGEDAVEVVQSIGEQIRQRDMVLLAALKHMEQLKAVVDGLHQSSAASSFDGKIARWLQEWGYPPEAADLAKEVYLAYEGDDLDEEFPKIFEHHWQQAEKLIEARRQAKITANRKQPFVPGKGGTAHPSKSLEIAPSASAKEIADQLFGTWDGTVT